MTPPREELLAALGADLPDDLLTTALTHRSYAYEHGGLPTNERLELLGDAVLGLVIVEELFRRHPDSSEGDLAKLRNSIVNSRALAGVARRLTAVRSTPADTRSPASWPIPSNRCSARSISSTASMVRAQ